MPYVMLCTIRGHVHKISTWGKGELSQRDFLERVVPSVMLGNEELLETSKEIMAIVVQKPGRLIDSDSRGEQ